MKKSCVDAEAPEQYTITIRKYIGMGGWAPWLEEVEHVGLGKD